ncbi:MAG: hypothetical protein CYG60_15430 [Actinobacteria bacterium]|nr:hypothetical protein [Actinomycetota bacterium]PLS84903.1 MAG: hypothetical protein CYG60_15430 [Actinomycetota bacterium]
MKGKGLGRLYDRLTPEERFRLDVEAMARGDREESERLTRTCPRRNYVMNDRGFAGRWQLAIELTLRVYARVAQLLERLHMLEAFRTLPPYANRLARNVAEEAYFDGHKAGSHSAWSAAGKTGNPPAWDGEDEDLHDEEEDPVIERDLKELDAKVEKYGELIPEILDRMERTVTADALTCWEGFAVFCADQLGLEAEKVLRVAIEEEAPRVEAMKSSAERLRLEADPERVEELRAALAECWSKTVEKNGLFEH